MMAKMMRTHITDEIERSFYKIGHFWVKSFPTVYEVKPISRDPENSRETIHFAFPREMGKPSDLHQL
jgi:hypothetical protein